MIETLLRRLVKTPFGLFELIGGEEGLAWVSLPGLGASSGRDAHLARWYKDAELKDAPRSHGDAVQQLKAWVSGEFAPFKLRLAPKGTEFQLEVWRALARVRAGKTLTYGELAARVQRPGAARAVGSAMRKNPLPLFVPCHRVLAGNGLGGFSGGVAGALDLKQRMLEHEGALKKQG
jgi:methylated-DNA-[protein]-cysteine S-methyltransferase